MATATCIGSLDAQDGGLHVATAVKHTAETRSDSTLRVEDWAPRITLMVWCGLQTTVIKQVALHKPWFASVCM